MMNGYSGLSPADVAALSGNGGGAWGEGGSWWLIVLFLFIFAGWNGNGNGILGGGGSMGAAENYVLASDFSQLSRQLDSGFQMLERKGDNINNGLCDGFYAQNTNLLTGFANAELSRANNQAATIAAINQNNIAAMQNQNALQAQIAQCCCDNRYENLVNANNTQNAINTGFCQTNYNNANNTRDLLDNQNNNTKAILDALAAQRTDALKERIAEQAQTINALQLAASQQAQNNFIVGQLKTPCPVPAYVVPSPCGCANNFYGGFYNGYGGTTIA